MEEIKLECLRLAVAVHDGSGVDNVIHSARKMFEFVTQIGGGHNLFSLESKSASTLGVVGQTPGQSNN